MNRTLSAPPLVASEPQPALHASNFRADIEGIRGIAILIVVAFHCGIPGFSGGFIGVDIFFALSGYLITGILFAEAGKTSRINLLQFYSRRARRLLPAAALVLLVTLIVGGVILSPDELAFAGRAARGTAVYMSNIFFASNAANYFAPDVESNPLLHTWSLAVEEQFYLFWPLLILLTLGLWKSKRLLVTCLSGLTILSLAVCVWMTGKGSTAAFYGLPARAWEFGLGGLAVLIPEGVWRFPAGRWLAAGWLGFLALLVSGKLITPDNFPGWIALAPVLGTIVVLVAGAQAPHRGVAVVLESAPLQFLGQHSYSWYLWHWPFLVFATAMMPGISVAGKTTAVVAGLVVAVITHRFVENPIRFMPYLVQRPALTLYLAAIVSAASLGAAMMSMRLADRLGKTPEMRPITAAVADIGRIRRQECDTPRDQAELRPCLFGNASSTTNIVLFGDSHALHWSNPLQKMADDHGWKLTTFIKANCPAAAIRVPFKRGAAFAASCVAWRAEAIRQITAMHPSLVIMASLTSYIGRTAPARRNQERVSFEELRSGSRETLALLTASGTKVAVIRDTPFFDFDVPTCLARFVRLPWRPSGVCEMDINVAMNPAVFAVEKSAGTGLSGVHFLDFSGKLCEGNVCFAARDGQILYRDDNHFTGRFADSLQPAIEAQVMPILKSGA